MAARTLLLPALLAVTLVGCARERASVPPPTPASAAATAQPAQPTAIAASVTPARVGFDREIRPILVARCSPCHFTGGTMYEKMPFDKAATIHTLGDKMFTRIKDEKEQTLLRAFLADPAAD